MVRVAVMVLLAGVVAIFAGTLVESRVTGSMAPCTRGLDIDSSTLQDGRASMHWIPPTIHCHFDSVVGEVGETRPMPAADENRFAFVGVALAEMITLLGAGFVLVAVRGYRRRVLA